MQYFFFLFLKLYFSTKKLLLEILSADIKGWCRKSDPVYTIHLYVCMRVYTSTRIIKSLFLLPYSGVSLFFDLLPVVLKWIFF